MKKNVLNKQLIKAVSLGISASMALQPVTALANDDVNSGDNTGDKVLEVENKTAEENAIENTEKAISDVQDKIVTAEKETGLTFDNSYDEVAEITGKVEKASEVVSEADENIKAAEKYSEKRDTALDEMNASLNENYDGNIKASKDDYDEVAKLADGVKELSDTVTEESLLVDAEKTVVEANAKYVEAQEKLNKAEKEYDAAKAAYDAAFENYKKASEEGSMSFISVNEAKRELEEAMEMLASKKQEVENQKASAEGYLETIKANDYQKIAESQDKLAKNEITNDEHAKLLIEVYVKANGGKDISFDTADKEFNAGLDENGEVSKETKTYNTVTYTNAEGKEVTELYTVINENGEVSVSKVDVVENKEVTIKEAVEGKDESWKTEDGKEFINSDTTHTIVVGENGEFIAIDTNSSENVSTDEDKKVKVPETTVEGNETKEYSEIEGTEKTVYEKATYIVDTLEKEAICEVKTREYKETTTIEKSGKSPYSPGKTQTELDKELEKLHSKGILNASGEVKSNKDEKNRTKYYYVITYTTTVTKEVSRTRYAADSYTVHQDAVEAQDPVYGTKLVTLGSFVEEDLQTKVEAQKNAVENQNKAVEAAKKAQEAYDDAVDAVKNAQAKVEELKKTNTPVVTLAKASAELKIAMNKLSEATAKKNVADKAVEAATTALNNANSALTSLQNKAKAEAEAKAQQNSSSSSATVMETVTGTTDSTAVLSTVATNTKKATTAVAKETPEVLGVVKTTSDSKKASTKKASKTSNATAKDSSSEVKNDAEVKEVETVAKADEKTEAVAEDNKTLETQDQGSQTNDTQNSQAVTIGEEDTALAAQQEKHFPGLALVIIGTLGALGITTEEIVRRNKKKVKVKNSTKNNK